MAAKKTTRKRCPSCGVPFRKGALVYMLTGKLLKRRSVCAKCERSAVRILIEPPALARHDAAYYAERCR